MPDQRLTQLNPLVAVPANPANLLFYVVDLTEPILADQSKRSPLSLIDARYLQTANNLSDLTNAVVARASLGLGTLATVNDAPADGTIYGRQNNAWAAASGILPVVDTTAIVKGSVTDTKLLRFEVDGFTAATTRVATWPDADMTVAGLEVANVFTANQTISKASPIFKLVTPDNSTDAYLSLFVTGRQEWRIMNEHTSGDLHFIRSNGDAVVQIDRVTGQLLAGEIYCLPATAISAKITLNTNTGDAVSDPFIRMFRTGDANQWSFGMDVSDSNQLIWSKFQTLGTNNYMALTTNGRLKIDYIQELTASAGINFEDYKLIRPVLKDYGESVNAIGDFGGGAQAINLENGNVVSATVSTGAVTFSFTNPPASGISGSFTLILTNGGSQTVNWPVSVDWVGGVAPSLTAAGRDVLTFFTIDGGTIWYGFAAGLDMK